MKIVLYAPDEAAAGRAAEAAFDRIGQLNGVLSDYDPASELRKLCDTAGTGKAVRVSDDLWRVLTAAQSVSERSGGAFDVTVSPVVRLWRRARRRYELPPPEDLKQARSLVGYRLLKLDPAEHSVQLPRAGMRLDLGGIAKGFATDEALTVLARHGIARALIDAGGDIRLGRGPPGRPGWRIGVAPPEAGAPPSRFVWLSQCGIATSGDAFQFVAINGRRYSHIVDPATGVGLTDHSTVTIVAPDGTTADALASAVSVLGPEKGLKLAENTPGTSALVVRAPDDGAVQTYESRGWKDLPAAGVGEE